MVRRQSSELAVEVLKAAGEQSAADWSANIQARGLGAQLKMPGGGLSWTVATPNLPRPLAVSYNRGVVTRRVGAYLKYRTQRSGERMVPREILAKFRYPLDSVVACTDTCFSFGVVMELDTVELVMEVGGIRVSMILRLST